MVDELGNPRLADRDGYDDGFETMSCQLPDISLEKVNPGGPHKRLWQSGTGRDHPQTATACHNECEIAQGPAHVLDSNSKRAAS